MDNNKTKKQNGMVAEKTASQPKALRKNKKYLTIMFVGLGLIAASFVFKSKDTGVDEVVLETKDQGTQNLEEAKNGQENYLEGVLQLSDNAEKGNLKLSSKEGDIYLRTSRDFGALIGRSVLVIIEGTLENFRMVDVQAKLEDDGFLRSN